MVDLLSFFIFRCIVLFLSRHLEMEVFTATNLDLDLDWD